MPAPRQPPTAQAAAAPKRSLSAPLHTDAAEIRSTQDTLSLSCPEKSN